MAKYRTNEITIKQGERVVEVGLVLLYEDKVIATFQGQGYEKNKEIAIKVKKVLNFMDDGHRLIHPNMFIVL